MNIFTANHTSVMVYIDDHRLYYILASLYILESWMELVRRIPF